MYPQALNEKRKMSTCKRLDFKTVGSLALELEFSPNTGGHGGDGKASSELRSGKALKRKMKESAKC